MAIGREYLERASGNLLVAEVNIGIIDARLCWLKTDLERIVLDGFGGNGNISTLRISDR